MEGGGAPGRLVSALPRGRWPSLVEGCRAGGMAVAERTGDVDRSKEHRVPKDFHSDEAHRA